METMFSAGQVVALRADRTRAGSITEVLPPAGGSTRYRVFHGLGDVWVYDEDQLQEVALTASAGGLGEAIAAGRCLGAADFKARLTAARLTHQEVDSLYALHAARIQFIPFQLKPLLRFLRADQPRLLVADEVGVGKTIEAGLILKELETRQEVENVLIVCPKALTYKWRQEMLRFDEDFRVLTAESLRYCLDETVRDGGVWPQQYRRAIVHLELARMTGYLNGTDDRRQRPGLRTLDPPPQFDLLIVDEAHHVRNPGTLSQELASTLCAMSEAVVFLSATPVQVGSNNLFHLLHLLRPDLFPDEGVFQAVLEPNQFITEAMSQIRYRPSADTWQRAAAEALQAALATSWGRNVLSRDALFREWQQKLRRGEVSGDADRIRCLRDLEEVHSLAQVMNRTRRRDIGRFTIREPRTVSVPFTPEQELFYGALLRFRQDVLQLDYDPQVIRLITDTLERQAASCLPALAASIDRVLQTNSFNLDDLTDDIDLEQEVERTPIPRGLIDQARNLRLQAAALPNDDPKFDQLRTVVGQTLAEEGPGKILIFSFFLHTLAYLQERLSETGCRVATISGRVPDEEREVLRDRFRLSRQDPRALDVLLSSEVGCEGLDYEFCDRLVNYDIPWNPMRIEQRIGRIDRYGQQADKVFIFNFITPNTVEERIFFRCFERLDIFRHAVGDLEEVLGDVVQKLNAAALDPKLSPEQAEARAQQVSDNAVRLIDEQRRLEEEGGTLLGMDYLDEVDDLLAEGKFVSPDDLRLMIERFLAIPELEGRLTPDRQRPGLYRLILRRESRQELVPRLQRLYRQDRSATVLLQWLKGGDPDLSITFDQATAREQRDIPFITPVHALARLAIDHWAQQEAELVSHLEVNDGQVAPGRYLFACELAVAKAMKAEVRLVGLAYNLDTEQVDETVSHQLIRLLGAASGPIDAGPLSPSEIDTGLARLDGLSRQLRLRDLQTLRERNDTLVARKLGSLDSYYRVRLQRVEREIAAATNERITRMRQSEKLRIAQEYATERDGIEERRTADIVTRRLAAGVLEVNRAE